MFKKIGSLFGGDPNKRKIDQLRLIVDQINTLETGLEALSNEQLSAKTVDFRQRLKDGATLDDLLPEAFAVVREASKRTLGQRHYDVQLICGITLHSGEIAEMRTGEGKTLAGTLPVYLNALTGKGVHLITVNDYLARRDGRWMGNIYHLLGMSVGILQMAANTENGKKAYLYDPSIESSQEDQHQLRLVDRKEAYAADITYGTNSEFGFDYLRDNLTMNLGGRVQRGHYYAIIDEVDNILIDEARTPLIISGPAQDDAEWYNRMALVVRQLEPEHYEVEEKDHTVTLTEIGNARVEEILGIPLRDPDRPEDITPEQARLLGFLEQALRAEFLFRKNKEYLVQNGQVVIVDEFTGRLMPGRRWSDGLHQAVEAKEGVKVQAENVTYATITIQNYFRMYEKLSGMTGTAETEAEEFYKIYKLDVLPIPTNLENQAMGKDSMFIELEARDEEGYPYRYFARRDDAARSPLFYRRKDYPDIVFRSEEAKLRNMVQEIIRYHVLGRPQLVGTTSVENSEKLDQRLSADFVRRLMQTLLVRQAWMEKNGYEEGQMLSADALKPIYQPLDALRPPELRRFAAEFGLMSINPTDAENHDLLLRVMKLDAVHLERLLKVIDGGVKHQVLNARKHTEESLIIASAGAFGAVTIATNMAGRGVDIKLGGELPESVLSNVNRVLARAGHVDPYNMDMPERLDAVGRLADDAFGIYEDDVKAFIQYMDEMQRVRELGGLHVIGSERHEARRIDNQLRGRAARQGDPGSSRFYLSMDDELMRLFGGAQMEAMMMRLRIDEMMPIEHGIVNRIVESSQTRVEGANFDVRKHLLEYDDVLNDQRKRIYTQRDRIFTKENLCEDVTEMLRNELAKRIETALADEEGPWKLLAYLDQTQPPIDFEQITHPTYGLKHVMAQITARQDADALKKQLLSLAMQAVEAENEHIFNAARKMIEQSLVSFDSAVAERMDALDTFFENLDEDVEMPTNDLMAELSNLAKFPLRLSPEQVKKLREKNKAFFKEIKKQVENVILQVYSRRMVMSLERRLNESLEIKPQELAALDWDGMEKMLLNRLTESQKRRVERLLGEQGEIVRDLDNFSEHVNAALTDDDELLRVLMAMTQGTVIAFDSKSHRKQTRAIMRLTYVFVAAQWLAGKTTAEITAEVLAHLEEAQEKLRLVFGQAEFTRHAQSGATLAQLGGAKEKEKIRQVLGEAQYTTLQAEPLLTLSSENKTAISDVLGDVIQNHLYRQILLGQISELWVDYLTRVEALRVSIRMEAYAQKDPLIQYKSKASQMFSQLLSDIRAAVISRMFNYRVTTPEMQKQRQEAVEGRMLPSGGKTSASKKHSKKRH